MCGSRSAVLLLENLVSDGVFIVQQCKVSQSECGGMNLQPPFPARRIMFTTQLTNQTGKDTKKRGSSGGEEMSLKTKSGT